MPRNDLQSAGVSEAFEGFGIVMLVPLSARGEDRRPLLAVAAGCLLPTAEML